jgi:hypothetical protein
MPSLQATSFKRFQLLVFASRFVSFALFGCLLCAGWIALSYFKNSVPTQRNLIIPATNQTTSANPANKKAESQVITEVKSSSGVSQLIYLLPSDKEHFHTLKHLPATAERIVLSEDAAIERGLKPCPLCFSK